MPRIVDAADLAAATGALIGAAARGLITPAEAKSLAPVWEAAARAVEIGERIGRERLAVEQEAVERRLALRTAALMFYGVREIAEEVGAIDRRFAELAWPSLRLGEAALGALAAIPDTPELVAADIAFLAAHPPRLDREASPLATAMAGAWQELEEYLGRYTLNRLERDIAERRTAGQTVTPRHRTGFFERLCGFPLPLEASGSEQAAV